MVIKNACIFSLIFIVAQFTLPLINVAAAEEPDTEYYRVIEGKVDAGTFLGWKTYVQTCVMCHGPGASGTELAPDLTDSIKRFSLNDFRIRVLNSYLISVSTEELRSENKTAVREWFAREISKEEKREQQGQMDMPNWEANPVVKQRIRNLYGYLKARSDGVIDSGKLELIQK